MIPKTEVMPLEEAKAKGAIAMFWRKIQRSSPSDGCSWCIDGIVWGKLMYIITAEIGLF